MFKDICIMVIYKKTLKPNGLRIEAIISYKGSKVKLQAVYMLVASFRLEVRGGIEPPHRSFADSCVTSSPSHQTRLILPQSRLKTNREVWESVNFCLVILVPFWYPNFHSRVSGVKNFIFMQRKLLLAVGVILVILGIGGVFVKDKLMPSQAGIQIETNPQATVYINGEEVGTTPHQTERQSGEIILRLVPIATNGSLAPWGTKVNLATGVRTVIKRDFGETEAKSAGEVLSFEKISGKQSSFAVVSWPDSAEVLVDGISRGFTPLKVNELSVGEHNIIISRQGFAPREIRARSESGYKLTVEAFLKQLDEEPVQADSTESAKPKEDSIEILNTPTGFLRVRTEPATSATESAQVKPGEKYPYLDQNTGGDWFKIEYEKGKEGWISAQYAKKVEKEGN